MQGYFNLVSQTYIVHFFAAIRMLLVIVCQNYKNQVPSAFLNEALPKDMFSCLQKRDMYTIIQKGNNYFVSIPEYICNILYITKLPAMNSSALIGGIFIKNPLQDLLSSKNALISTNESTRFITVHVPENHLCM